MIVEEITLSWVRGASLALMLAACGCSARAQGIAFVTPSQGIYYAPVPVSYSIDITGSGSPDFILVSDGVGGSFLYSQGSNSMIVVPLPPPDIGTFVAALNQGDEIGATPSSLNPVYEWYDASTDPIGYSVIGGQVSFDGTTYANGFFVGQPSAYIGFDLVRGGENYYGWMQVSNPYPVNAGQIVDWACETSPNTPIRAGQISEPVSFSANLAGANEMPPKRSNNSGTGTFMLESFVGSFVLTYHLEFNGSLQQPDAGIFGPATRGERPPVLIADLGQGTVTNPVPPIYVPLKETMDFPSSTPLHLSGPIPWLPSLLVYDGQINLTSNQAVQLLRGEFYVNLKSAKFRQGELRGQIWPSAPIYFSAALSARTEFSRNQHTPRGEAQFTLSGTALSYEIALDTNFTRIIAGIYGPGFPQAEIGNRMIWLNTTNAVRIPPGGLPNSPGFPGQLLYCGRLTLPDRQINELDSGQSYLEVLAPGCRNGWMGGRITQTP